MKRRMKPTLIIVLTLCITQNAATPNAANAKETPAIIATTISSPLQQSKRDQKTVTGDIQRRINPAYLDPENPDPKLPNVLIIGDSISIGYMAPLRKELSGTANVYRPKTNCGPSSKGLDEIDAWIGDRRWSLIQINHGLHDLKYMGPEGQNLADPKAESSHQQIPPEQYAKNLDLLAERLKKTGATIIWCETTPVPEGAAGRVVGDSKKYNAIAKKVMNEHGITTNGLFDFALKNVPTRPANVHYTAENSQKLAAFVAASIKENL